MRTPSPATIDDRSLNPADIPVRRITFADPLEGLPRHFATDENIVMSHLIVQLSAVFPPGEDFFVRSVREFRADITDDGLRRRVNLFIGQEAVHGREHRALNERLDNLGYRASRVSAFIDKQLKRQSRFAKPITNLAATAAVEHFTAVLGEALLTSDATSYVGHDAMTAMLTWHALEECEHKAVAFDLYTHVGGGEKRRRRTMNFVTLTFIARMTYLTIKSLLRDRATYRPGRLRRDLKNALATPLFDRAIWTALRSYVRSDFHPNDSDTDALILEWRDRLFGEDGELAAHIAG